MAGEKLLSRKALFEESEYNVNDASLLDRITKSWEDLQVFLVNVYEMGQSDPRQIIFAAKSGLALAFVSILIFFKEPFSYISQHSLWSILTVIAVFEFSIGATLSKGFTRGLGTVLAAILAFGVSEVSVWAGVWQEAVVVISLFTAGTLSSYLKLYPSMMPYDYGFRVFTLSFSVVMVSETSQFFQTAVSRLLLASVGGSISLIVNICIYPIWSGEDLHKLVVKNFRSVATSLEGINLSSILFFVLWSHACNWEPPHGPYKMLRYPWSQFVKVSGALRHCAFMVMSLHGCILSEIQKRDSKSWDRRCKSTAELGNKLEKLSPGFDLLDKVHEAAEDLQMLIDQKSYHLVKSEKWAAARRPKEFEDVDHLQDIKDEETRMDSFRETSHFKPSHHRHAITNMSINNPSCFGMNSEEQLQWPSRLSVLGDVVMNEREIRTYESASALSLANFTSSLIEFVARLQNLLNSYQELSDKAIFS
ncbi:hypothetical protein L1987_24365 [Smallanthus sonchifolius]|uniref:Uncharacterized protein n=1 Tax=Smallanthus sonchifolius TaxID=185202 RepID=A0ACB9IKG0_9ASTR|nr:hypothetical protein L1987_24365 [Smallanthus sonchifolius]